MELCNAQDLANAMDVFAATSYSKASLHPKRLERVNEQKYLEGNGYDVACYLHHCSYYRIRDAKLKVDLGEQLLVVASNA